MLYGIKFLADHGGSSPGGVLERAARPQPSRSCRTPGVSTYKIFNVDHVFNKDPFL